jgi:hypothetical protein
MSPVIVLLFAVPLLAVGQPTRVDFNDLELGRAPKGFSFGLTAKTGQPGEWLVKEDPAMRERGRFLAQTRPDRTRQRFPLAVLDAVSARDVDASVRFAPISGSVDQAAGLVWRYQDEDNYYIVRANALENNVVLYKVEKGKRTDLPLRGEGRTYGKEATVPRGQWSELRVVAQGPVFQVYFNGQKLYEVEDTTFTGAGKVGVWTKADSVTYFDDLTVTVR